MSAWTVIAGAAYIRVGDNVFIYENGARRVTRSRRLPAALLARLSYGDPEDFPFVEWFGGTPCVLK